MKAKSRPGRSRYALAAVALVAVVGIMLTAPGHPHAVTARPADGILAPETTAGGFAARYDAHGGSAANASHRLPLPPTTRATSGQEPTIEPRSYLETFAGQPAAPTPWQPSDWDVAVHSRNRDTWFTLEPMEAQHDHTCAPPPTTHTISRYEDAVFICRDHVMTAINASGYGAIYLTPAQLVDFSRGEATVRFDMSTVRTSSRDWVDLWLTPYENNLVLPLEDWLPDLNGPPRHAIHLRMDQFFAIDTGRNTFFRGTLYRHWAKQEIRSSSSSIGLERFLTADPARRHTFELRVSRGRLKFGMPQYNVWWIDTVIEDLGWDRAVLQLGHHSYTPTKDCVPGRCSPNTWHWDNVSISSAVPFTMLRADRPYVDRASEPTVRFAAPAPDDAHVRFAALGNAVQVSFDGGNTWEVALPQAQQGYKPSVFQSYWTPIPAGTTAVQFKAEGGWWGREWMVRHIAVWAPGTNATATAVESPATPIGISLTETYN